MVTKMLTESEMFELEDLEFILSRIWFVGGDYYDKKNGCLSNRYRFLNAKFFGDPVKSEDTNDKG